MNKRITLLIMQQVDPPTPRPFRLIQTYPTVDGIRSRLCEGAWSTFDDCEQARQLHIKARSA